MQPLRRPESFAACSRRWCLVLGAIALLCGGASAQSASDGAVEGVARNLNGSPLPGAQLDLVSNGAEPSRRAVADKDGRFLFPHVAAGEYVLRLLAAGPSSLTDAIITVSAGAVTEVRQTGGASVAAEAPETVALPDENGDGLQSLHGLEAMQSGASLDGSNVVQAFNSVPAGSGSDPAPDPDGDSDSADRSAGPANGLARGRHEGVAYVFSQSSVREVRAAGQSYSAGSGRAAGGVVTTISRAGGERLHGSGAFTLRSQMFAASSPLSVATSYADGVVTSATVKPHDLKENFGGALGGPVPHAARLYFLETLDVQRRGFPAISSPGDPNFYSLTVIQSALLANRGLSGPQIGRALNYVSSLTGTTPRRADETLNFARLDWRPKEPVAWVPALSAEYNAVRWHSPAGLIAAPVVARGRASLGSAAGSLDAVVLRVVSTPSRLMLNQFRVGFVRDLQYESPQTPLAQEPAISPGGLAPEVTIGPNGLLFGTPASLSQVAYPDERRVELADTVTLSRGRHSMDVGVDVSFVRDQAGTLADAAGTFRYDSGATGGRAGGLVDFITDYTFNVNTLPNGGCPSIVAATHLFCFTSYAQSFGAQQAAFSTEEWAAFVEDTWRVRRGLTVHAGVRYEYTLLPLPQTPNAALDALFGARGATSVFPEDRNNLGPRVALAWEPLGAGGGVVRLGYGVFFGRLPGATIVAALSNTAQLSATSRIRITPSALIACPQNPANGFGYPCAFQTQPGAVVGATTNATVFDRRFRLPVVQQGSLELERTLRHRTSVSATYVVNIDRQLATTTDLNIAPSTQTRVFQLQGGTGAAGVRDGETFALPVYATRISPSFGPVTDIVSNVNASYHGLTLAAVSRPVAGLMLRAAYTWSKAIDFGQAQSATPRTNAQLDPFTDGYDKGLSSLNYPWALRAAAEWQPEVHGGRQWLREAANHWQLAPVVSARAGRPYSYDLYGGTHLAGGHDSLNGSGGALYLPTVGRNTLRLPATVDTELRMSRSLRIGSKLQLQVSAEAFNLFNHRNVSSVSQRAYLVGTALSGVTPLVFQSAANIAAEGLSTQPFGTPTAAGTSLTRERQVQLGVRLGF